MTRTVDVLVIDSQRRAVPRRPFDPYADRVTERTDDPADTVAAVERAVDEALASLRRTVLTTIAPLLRDEDIDPVDTTVEVVCQARALHVRVRLPVDPDEPLRQAVAVRALAALHGARGNHATIGISVDGPG